MGRELNQAFLNFGATIGDVNDRLNKKKQQDIANELALAEEKRKAASAPLELRALQQGVSLGDLKLSAGQSELDRTNADRVANDALLKDIPADLTQYVGARSNPLNQYTGMQSPSAAPDLGVERLPMMSDAEGSAAGSILPNMDKIRNLSGQSPVQFKASQPWAASALPAAEQGRKALEDLQNQENFGLKEQNDLLGKAASVDNWKEKMDYAETLRRQALKDKLDTDNIPDDMKTGIVEDARLVVSGKKAYTSLATKYSSRGQAGIPLKTLLDQEILKANPDFDFEMNAQHKRNAEDPIFKRQMVFANSLLDRMEYATQALNAYTKGDIKGFNKLSMKLGIETGDPKSVVAKVNQFLVADEAQRLIGSGQGSEGTLELSHQLADPSLSPAQAKAVMGTVKSYVQARRDEILSSMGPFGKMYNKDYSTPEEKAAASGKSFANEAEAEAAAARGEIKSGDRVTIGGQTGTWSE